MTLPPTNPTISSQNNGPNDLRTFLRRSTTFYDRVVTDWWWWELLSMAVSFLSVAAIVAMLWYYDGKKQPEHVVSGITLNAYISVFAAVSKAALILPVSEAIGQLKWLWFHKDAALWDFQLYDSASRGPWGSLMLLLKTKYNHLVSFGALITILALAFEPFFQQIVTYPQRLTPTSQGFTWAATTFFPQQIDIVRKLGYSDGDKDPSMRLVVETAFNTPEISTRPSSSICPTGQCTWPTYSTLGVCHQCEDVSYLLQYICKNHTLIDSSHRSSGALDPCGFRLNNTFIVGSSNAIGSRQVTSLSTLIVDTFKSPGEFEPFMNTTMYANATLPIADFYIGYTPGGPPAVLRNETPVLVECLLTWCVKTIESKFINGALQESIVDTITIQPQTRDKNGYTPTVARMGSNTTFTIANGTTQQLRDLVLSNMPYSLEQDPKSKFYPFPGIWQFHQQPPYNLEMHLNNITKAITNNLKSRSMGTERVDGIAWTSEQFVQIRWAWIALPAASLFGSMILVCGTIWKGRRSNAPVWKSSALATLLHGLSEETRNHINPSLSSSQIEAISTKMRVQLSSRGGDAYLAAI